MAIGALRRQGLNPRTKFRERNERLMDVLRQTPFLAGLNDTELEALVASMIVARYRANQILFVEGEPSRSLYFMLSGRVKVYRESRDGREQIVNIMGEGETIAVVPFCDGGEHPATGEVIEDAEIAQLQCSDFRRIARKHPDILFGMLHLLAKRVRRAQEEIHSLSLRTVMARLAYKLLELSDEYGERVKDGVEIELRLSRQEMGSLVGTSRETTTRLLQQFQKERVIRVDGARITILKPAVLQSWSEV